MSDTIHLGYELGSGQAVAIPLHHTVVTGLTQHAGKTTTIEGLIARSGLRALCFSTKRGEIGFSGAREVRPYFRERADWQYVEAILSATLREKLRFERSWIMKACRDATTLAQVHANIKHARATTKRGIDESVYTSLDHYLEIVVPQIAKARFATELRLGPGLNLMDLGALSDEMQALVIRSAIEHVMEHEKHVVTVIPEAWQFLPNGRRGPVHYAAESLIREGAILGNWMWLDSQDIVGVDTLFRKGCGVWLLGKQTETNEAERTVKQVPVPASKRPAVADVMALGKGQFFACFDGGVRKVYVQPAWLEAEPARKVAVGQIAAIVDFNQRHPAPRRVAFAQQPKEDDVDQATATRITQENEDLRRQLAASIETLERTERARKQAEADMRGRERQLEGFQELGRAWAKAFGAGPTVAGASVDEDALVERIILRLPAGGGTRVQIMAPEALAQQVQQDVAARIVADAKALPAAAKKILKFLIVADKRLPQKEAAARAGYAWGGSLTAAFKAMQDGALIDSTTNGTKAAVRERIMRELGDLGAKPEDVEAVYQHVLHALATEGA